MKIACLSPDDHSTLIFCKTFIDILKKDIDADVYTISPIDLYRNEIENLKSTHIEIKMFRWISIFSDITYMINLFKIFKKNKFDHIITFTTKPNIYGPIIASLVGVKNITIAVRGLGQAFNTKKTFKQIVLRLILKYLYKLSCTRSHQVWFTNKSDQKLFINEKIVNQDKTVISKNALDLNFFSINSVNDNRLAFLRKELNIKPGDQVVIMVARLILSKGIREYVNAAIELKDKFPRLHFILVAPVEENSNESISEKYILISEQHSNLKWLGFRKDVRELYAISDISVLPSYYREGGYPRALLEAMALSKPVIAADTDHCRSPVEEGKNGYIIPIKDYLALSEAIEKIIISKNRLLEFGKYSRIKVENEFDDQKVIRSVLKKINIY
tara:strand:- start:8696 stop:9853 length:1158 start_codon:yes stop_codon:yes gene_type:complete